MDIASACRTQSIGAIAPAHVKHTGTGTECVKSCIKNGMKPVFVDSAKKEVWTIDNPSEVTPAFYGAPAPSCIICKPVENKRHGFIYRGNRCRVSPASRKQDAGGMIKWP